MTREQHLVELVDSAGNAIGRTTVAQAHQPPGQLHRAFSVVLLDPRGRVLLQKRAAAKTRFPLRWANACCGHPEPGIPVTQSANRRLDEELGLSRLDVDIDEFGIYIYRANDPVTGRVEHEYDHVLVARVDSDLALLPDPAEVAEVRWAEHDDIAAGYAREPDSYAPWLPGVVGLVLNAR